MEMTVERRMGRGRPSVEFEDTVEIIGQQRWNRSGNG